MIAFWKRVTSLLLWAVKGYLKGQKTSIAMKWPWFRLLFAVKQVEKRKLISHYDNWIDLALEKGKIIRAIPTYEAPSIGIKMGIVILKKDKDLNEFSWILFTFIIFSPLKVAKFMRKKCVIYLIAQK